MLRVQGTGAKAVAGGCAAIFWPGAFVFGLPGVMAQHWQVTFQIGRADVGKTLFFVLAAVGVFMFLTGRMQDKVGSTRLAGLGVLVCGACTLFLGQASGIRFVYLWASLVGISTALIYIPALTVVQQWYPHRRGLVAGLVNLSFGLSGAVISPITSWMITHLGHQGTTLVLGAAALVLGFGAIPWLKSPGVPTAPPAPRVSGAAPAPGPSFTVSQSLRTRAFWFLWLTWAFAGSAGISMVTLSTGFGTARGLSFHEAVLLLTAFNLTNGISRLLGGYLSDLFGRNITMAVAFLGAGCAYFLFSHVHGLPAWVVLASAIGFAFGTLFSVSAALTSDCFGMAHFGAIYGLEFTAYGFVAGVLGPWLSGYVLDVTHSNFRIVFTYLGLFCLASAVFIWFARPPARKA